MYQITTQTGVLGYTDAPSYCYKLPSGSPQVLRERDRAKATAVIYGSAVYNLPGHTEFPDAGTATVNEVDAGNVATRQREQLADVGAANSIVFVTLAEAGQLDDVTAGEHMALFALWEPDVACSVGALRRYAADEFGSTPKLYRCIQAHISQADWTPDVSPSLWREAADPAEEWPEWSQPIGAEDAYGADAKVSHNGTRWTSDVDANVWEPGVYGWTEVENE